MLFRKDRSEASSAGADDTHSFWASYSDLMAAVVMVFVLTTAVALYHYHDSLQHYETTMREPMEAVQEWNGIIARLRGDAVVGKHIDSKGTLVITSDLLQFDRNESDLREEGKRYLRTHLPRYLSLFFDNPIHRKRVSVIEISGHTDRKDAHGANPAVSRDRAGQVLKFLLDDPGFHRFEGYLKQYAITAGYAATKEPEGGCQSDDCQAARRVEIAVKFDTNEILEQVAKLDRHHE